VSGFGDPLFDEVLFDEGAGPSNSKWDLGLDWTIISACARRGIFGLSRIGDGVNGDSDATSTEPFEVVEGQSYYLSFWLKGDGSADGTISLGFAFYNSANVFISDAFIDSTGSPTVWTQFQGNIIVPVSAVTAVAIVRATNHLTGQWCVDTLFASVAGGHWVLSSIKHYSSPFTSYR
jgi:hypothetical protein